MGTEGLSIEDCRLTIAEPLVALNPQSAIHDQQSTMDPRWLK
jgi:hypothetical protein